MDDLISRQAAIDAIRKGYPDAINSDYKDGLRIGTDRAIYHVEQLPSAQPEIIRCKDCKYWVPGYITDNDDFIPPKCGEWQQMVGHSSDDYCSFAERREDE